VQLEVRVKRLGISAANQRFGHRCLHREGAEDAENNTAIGLLCAPQQSLRLHGESAELAATDSHFQLHPGEIHGCTIPPFCGKVVIILGILMNKIARFGIAIIGIIIIAGAPPGG
jgi:hypothetical protein